MKKLRHRLRLVLLRRFTSMTIAPLQVFQIIAKPKVDMLFLLCFYLNRARTVVFVVFIRAIFPNEWLGVH